MPLIGKSYYCGIEGKLKVYDHVTNVWVDKSVSSTRTFYDVKTSTTNPDKIIIGGPNELNYSIDAGTTLVASTGNWITFVPTIFQISYTSNFNIIYASGNGGLVKSVDGGVSFNRVDSFNTSGGLLCYSLHFINDSVGIVAKGPKLFKTTDGGISWNALYSGGVIDSANPTDSITGLHLSSNQLTIIVTTKRKIFRSTDGGIGFTMVNNYGTTTSTMGQVPKYNHLSWLNDNVLINSAGSGNVLYSNNAGASWSNSTGFLSGGDSKYACSLFEGFVAPGDPIGFYSSDVLGQINFLEQTGVNTFTSSVSDTYDKPVYALTSLVFNVTCYELTPCSQEGNIIVASNIELSSYVGGYVNIDGSCFFVAEGEDCSNTIHLNYTTIAFAANCAACNPPENIYALRDCIAIQETLYTTEILTPGISGVIGQIVYIAGYPNTCWTVVEQSGDTPEAITLLNDFGTCSDCAAQLPGPPPVYELTNCLDPLTIRYTYNSQFAQAIELVVHLTLDPEECWSVAQIEFDDQETIDVSILENEAGVLQIFEDCECCLPTPDPAPVKYTRVIPKPDRKFYQIKESQCDIKANIRFADNYYRLFKMLKYGINSMCDNVELDKVWIKKMQSDLAIINDPTACVITTPPVPVVCPEPEGNPFVPPAPYIFTVGETEIGQGTLGCTICLDGSLPGPGLVCPAFNISLSYNILDTVNPDAAYVFSYNGGCVVTLGSFIAAGQTEGFPVYDMLETDIVNAGVSPEDPCASCGG